MIATTNAVAKIAAVVAGLGLVAMSFASFAPAAKAATTDELQAQVNALLAQIASLQGGASASVTFTRDLTLGSSGADVTALQNWLIKGGYSIPAGATGYFGAQTQAALAAYQKANGITPAAGYFGPITRAKVNASAGGSTGGTGSTGGLSGGEADLTDYELRSEESDGNEGEEDVEIATAMFDVEDADVEVQRVEVDFQAENTSDSVRPWDYFENVSIWMNGKKLADMDVDSRADWDENDADSAHDASAADYYRLAFTGLDEVVDEGDTAEITIAATIAGTIDSADLTQQFEILVDDEGIRARDGAGIDQYTGNDSETTSFGFGEEESGDLTIKESDEDPDASILVAVDDESSDEFTVFAFDLDNNDDVDTLVTEMTFTVATTVGNGGPAVNITDIVRRATLSFGGEEFDGDINSNNTITFEDIDSEVAGDDTETGIVTVELLSQSGNYAATGESLRFTLSNSNVEAEGVDSGDDADVGGSYQGATHTIALSGIVVEAVSVSSDAVISPGNDSQKSYGTFTIKFDVTALDDDAYIPNSAASSTGSTTFAGAIFDTFRNGNPATLAGTSTTASLSSSATLTNGFYKVSEGTTRQFTLTVVVNPDSTSGAGQYAIDLNSLQFATTTTSFSSNKATATVDDNNGDFQTDPEQILE